MDSSTSKGKSESYIDSLEHVLARTIIITIKIFVYTIGTFLLFGMLLGVINNGSQEMMYKSVGWVGILLTGFIGTPVHEFSHYLMCKIFGMNVYDVSWFRPIQGQYDGELGYVRYSIMSDSIWQHIGCFFVGIAPLIIGTLIIILLFRFMFANEFKNIMHDVSQRIKNEQMNFSTLFSISMQIIKGIIKIPYKSGKNTIIKYIIFMVTMFSISSHMKLSVSDLVGASKGIGILVLIMFIIGLIVEIKELSIKKTLVKISAIITSFFSVSVIFSIISFLISFVIYVIAGIF